MVQYFNNSRKFGQGGDQHRIDNTGDLDPSIAVAGKSGAEYFHYGEHREDIDRDSTIGLMNRLAENQVKIVERFRRFRPKLSRTSRKSPADHTLSVAIAGRKISLNETLKALEIVDDYGRIILENVPCAPAPKG